MATSYYDSFIKKLEEVFMMDHAELDFGIYRIMNQKRNDIKQFLEKDLLPQVKKTLAENAGGASEADKSRLAALQQQLGSDIDSLPETIPMVREYKQLKAKLEQSADTEALENEVYSHLTTFFGRYYDGGDFISKRRYKDNTYAIPYNGEEVKLHWANSDQYYIKTSEYFQNYTFKTPDGKMVHFVLKDASTEQNNNKSQNNMERRFALYAEEGQTSVEVVDGELNIYFTYELMPKATKQKDLNAQALESLKDLITDSWTVLLSQISASDTRSLLEKHITDYTAKNSFDYFIHKDLGGFLRRELDFYIKNEVMHIDDLDVNHINAQLAKVKAIKGVGDKIIRFLASLEDFQKKLWLKKKFVVQTDYCITLDRVPEELYPEICANDAQRKEWVRLFAIDEIRGSGMFEVGYSEPLKVEFLKANPFLVLDTAFFADGFKHKLLASLENVDKETNGLLINSENFQGSSTVLPIIESKIKCVYLDPPYNTSDTGFVYKNNYRHSSWATMMYDRLQNCFKALEPDGVLLITIDDEELYDLKELVDVCIGSEHYIGTIVIEANPRGRGINSYFATCHEYCLAYAKNPENVVIVDNELTEEQQNLYSAENGEDEIAFRMLPFRRSGGWSTPEDRPNSEFPLFFNKEGILFAVGGERLYPTPNEYETKEIIVWDAKEQKSVVHDLVSFEQHFPDAFRIMPIDTQGMRRVWRWSDREKILRAGAIGDFQLKSDNRGRYVQLKDRIKSGRKPKTVWVDSKFDSSTHGTNLLKKILGERNAFGFPKSVFSTEESLHSIVGDEEAGDVLDLFGGSGTTAHAVIRLNRADGRARKFILCEMGEYFDKVTRTRIVKNIYSQDWDNGKPLKRDGFSQCLKYIRLEQYEDTLNNLIVREAETVFSNEENKSFKESYMLGYMLDTEMKGSLFNLEWFVNPFAMTLKTTKNNELVETKVDMVETFNFLIGLNVETIHWHQDDAICVVEGITHRDNEKTLVIWRDCTRVDNDQLIRFFEKMDYRTLAHDFDVIFINGDYKLPNLRLDNDRWKVVLIEEEFKKRMFEED